VAERLGLRYVDEEVIARAAERGGVEPGQLADAEQRKSRLLRVVELLTDMGTGSGIVGAEPSRRSPRRGTRSSSRTPRRSRSRAARGCCACS
jgi:hypothetical protein